WADEGASSTVEHDSERRKQQRMLIQFLQTRRGIAFNDMFAMTQYPKDILPLYAQGHSLATFLVAQGGKRKFLAYVKEGLATDDWTDATRSHYQFASLGRLQNAWLDWVRRGSPLPLETAQPEESNIKLVAVKNAKLPRPAGDLVYRETGASAETGTNGAADSFRDDFTPGPVLLQSSRPRSVEPARGVVSQGTARTAPAKRMGQSVYRGRGE
ncbi:MAG TPA: hypothetical protein VG125_07400, partial [Pirellulales bacterium]|nr:hypothetical protein [Pirellulales bacterium]